MTAATGDYSDNGAVGLLGGVGDVVPGCGVPVVGRGVVSGGGEQVVCGSGRVGLFRPV
ncbi:hypothetical protein [Austwickia sp. TVS 96-490-7B]|uniref:hypothetical protein n=1 Tax=Austwickia sp. TVS 96-490-7B TaxID=2830843 RepID=UPI001C561B23|nr:hypothetical protein [Austwickia sp. TVS 96-490-7B]